MRNIVLFPLAISLWVPMSGRAQTSALLDAARDGTLRGDRMASLLPAAVQELSGREVLQREHPELVKALSDQSVAVRVTASGLLQIISTMPDTDLKDFKGPLLACLGDANSQVRSNCLIAVASITPDTSMTEGITRLLRDPTPSVRIAAVSSIVRLRPLPSEALMEVVSALRSDKDDRVRGAAASSLAVAGDKGPAVLDALRDGLRDPTPSAVEQCVIALGVLDPTGDKSVAAVKAVLNRKDLTPTLRANVDSFLRRAQRVNSR